jgi:hypothetical protein
MQTAKEIVIRSFVCVRFKLFMPEGYARSAHPKAMRLDSGPWTSGHRKPQSEAYPSEVEYLLLESQILEPPYNMDAATVKRTFGEPPAARCSVKHCFVP